MKSFRIESGPSCLVFLTACLEDIHQVWYVSDNFLLVFKWSVRFNNNWLCFGIRTVLYWCQFMTICCFFHITLGSTTVGICKACTFLRLYGARTRIKALRL